MEEKEEKQDIVLDVHNAIIDGNVIFNYIKDNLEKEINNGEVSK